MTRRIQLLLMTLLLLMAGAGGILNLDGAGPRLAARNAGSAMAGQATATPPPIDAPSPPTPPVACCERPIGYPPRAEQLPTPAAGVQRYPYPYPAAYPGLHLESTR